MKTLLACAVALLMFAGCNAGDGDESMSREPETTPSSPSLAGDVDEIALRFSTVVQLVVDRASRAGRIELSALPLREVQPYGDVVVVKIETTNEPEVTTAALVLAGVAQAVNGLQETNNLPSGVDYAGFEDPSGATVLASVQDLLANVNGELTGRQLYHRLIYLNL